MDLLSKIYQRRFSEDLAFRQAMYKVLCEKFFVNYISADAVVLDVAAGYCEFINHIKAGKKIAVDLNPDMEKHAADDVETVLIDSISMPQISDASIDVAYVSNFFEHIPKEDIIKTIKEIRRVLKPEGRILILQPNFRYCYRDYWMFFDHITPIDDRSLMEVLEVCEFDIIENRPRFLPYTLKSRFPKSIFLLKLYLKIPLLHMIFGQQAFICAQKGSASQKG